MIASLLRALALTLTLFASAILLPKSEACLVVSCADAMGTSNTGDTSPGIQLLDEETCVADSCGDPMGTSNTGLSSGS